MHLCFTPSPGPRSIQSCSGGGMEAPLCLIPTLGPVRSVSPSFGRPTNLYTQPGLLYTQPPARPSWGTLVIQLCSPHSHQSKE